jgi:glycosyltransferase involved in cell wall biosynthesis
MSEARPRAPERPARIGFVRMGPHPIPNRLLVDALGAALAGAQIEVLDLEPLARRDRTVAIANAPFVAAEHGRNLASGRVRPWQAFFTTSYLFRWMSRRARGWAQARDFDWTIQIQSLFDARVPGVPHFVYTDHTHLANLDYPDFDRRTLRPERWLALERALYRDASLVFTRSAHVSRSLIDRYGCAPERTVCVGAGSNAQVPPRTAERAADGQDILFVGVDWERKGGPELAAAFAKVRARHPRATLTIVGCQPALSGPGVRVLGRRPVEEIHLDYQRADLFCLPTRREPFGVAFVEALHHGLPIVATRIGAVPDLVEHGVNGLLVEPGDVDALASALDLLLGDPALRRTMGDAGERRARDRYTWSAVAQHIAASVASVVRVSPPRSESWRSEPRVPS